MTNDRQEPEYHDVVAYRRLAELVGDYTRKGSLVLIQGHLHTAAAGRDRGVGAVPEPGAAPVRPGRASSCKPEPSECI